MNIVPIAIVESSLRLLERAEDGYLRLLRFDSVELRTIFRRRRMHKLGIVFLHMVVSGRPPERWVYVRINVEEISVVCEPFLQDIVPSLM